MWYCAQLKIIPMHVTITAQPQSAVTPVIRRADEMMRKRAILLNVAYVEL